MQVVGDVKMYPGTKVHGIRHLGSQFAGHSVRMLAMMKTKYGGWWVFNLEISESWNFGI